MIDDLVIEYVGNQRTKVTDNAPALSYEGSSDFVDVQDIDAFEYCYDFNGSLTKDRNRNIDSIYYDNSGNLERIRFSRVPNEGLALTERENLITYVYTTDGQKLNTSHHTTNFAGTTPLTMTATSTDYVGNLILKDGHPEMLRFDGGYISFVNDTISGIHYYIQDYMGNNRIVVNKDGTIEQITHYYPYGGVIGDISGNESLQKFKFEGKELDRTFGLDNYDIHARSYFAMAPTWDRPDPLSDDFPGISPYAYCGGDPVNRGDYDGRKFNYTDMTEEQKEMYFETVNNGRESNPLFDKLYTAMEQSSQVVNVRFGETITVNEKEGPVPAQYQPLKDNQGEIVINKNVETVSLIAITEEVMHSFQWDNRNNYGGACNVEFEAKVFKTIALFETAGIQQISGMNEFQNTIINGEYGNASCLVNIYNPSFLSDYQKYANGYSDYNIKYGIGNNQYKTKTTVNPYSLVKLLQNH